MKISDERLDSEASRDTIQGIKGEIGREVKINDIQRESQKSFFDATRGKDLIAYVKNWKVAKERIEKWKKEGGLDRVLEDREEVTARMDQQDKKFLEELYLVQAKLREITGYLFQKLKDTSQHSEINFAGSLIGKSEYKWEEVQRALDWIEWKKSGDIKFRVKYLNEGKTIVFDLGNKEENSYGWGSWETNPFRFFFIDKSEYKKSMERVIESENNLKKLLTGAFVVETVKNNIGSSATEIKKDYEKIFKAAVDEAILDFEMQVASKLIEWIQPTDQKAA